MSRKRNAVVQQEPEPLHPVLAELEAKARAAGLQTERHPDSNGGLWLNISFEGEGGPALACFWRDDRVDFLPSVTYLHCPDPVTAWRQLSEAAAVLMDKAADVFAVAKTEAA